MRVLLTGGYGCIGSWITRDLLQRGDQVWVYDLKEDLHRLELILEEADLQEVSFIRGDVTDLEHLCGALQDPESKEPPMFPVSYCSSAISRKVERRSSNVSAFAFHDPVGTPKLKRSRIDFKLFHAPTDLSWIGVFLRK